MMHTRQRMHAVFWGSESIPALKALGAHIRGVRLDVDAADAAENRGHRERARHATNLEQIVGRKNCPSALGSVRRVLRKEWEERKHTNLLPWSTNEAMVAGCWSRVAQPSESLSGGLRKQPAQQTKDLSSQSEWMQ